MTSTNAPIFNRHSSNIVEDNGIAVYDVAPIIPQGGKRKLPNGQARISRKSAVKRPAKLDFVPSDFSFYMLQCNHGISTSPGWYLYNWDNPIVSLPTTTGVPLNYGVPNRVRYRVDSEEYIGEQPLMLLPSYGMGSNVFSRARSFEMWFSLEPFARARAENLFPDAIKYLQLTSPPCTITGSVNSIENGHIEFLTAGSLEWDIPFLLIGGTNYEFSVEVKTDSNVTVSGLLMLDLGSTDRIFEVTWNDISQYSAFTTEFSDEFINPESLDTDWIKLIRDFRVEQGFDLVTARFRLEVSGPCEIRNPALHDKDRPAAGMSIPYRILQFGSENGTSVVVSADAEFMYLEGYGQQDSFQISEWARPMLLVCNEYDDKFSVFINGIEILIIEKNTDTMNTYYGDIGGNWLLISIGAMFKHIDISTMAFYSQPLSPEIQTFHQIVSFGGQWTEIASRNKNDQIYIADGAATAWSAKVLFPTMVDFTSGYSSGLRIDKALTLPDYTIPILLDGEPNDIIVVNNDNTTSSDFASRYFYLDNVAEMEFNDETIGLPIEYAFIGISPFDVLDNDYPSKIRNNNILKIWSPEVPDIWCDIHITDLEDGFLNVKAVMNYEDQINYLELEKDVDELALNPPMFWTTVIPRKDFTLMFNLKKFAKHINKDVAILFSDPSITFTATSLAPYRFIALCTEEIGKANGLFLTDIPDISIDDKDRTVIGNTNYALYPGSETEIDVAGTGFWYISIPLVNLAAYKDNGEADLDYVLYFDQTQSPQLVSSNEAGRLIYGQVTQTVVNELKGIVEPKTIGQYADILQYAADNQWTYGDVGITSNSSALELGRFANNSLSTFVTLDSPQRWPSKKYWDLDTIYADTVPFIDFEVSTKSVKNTKWEIYDGYAIRFPKNMLFAKYYLGIGIHLRSMSLKKRLSFRYMDLYGVSNREYASNLIDVGGGSKILVGNELRVNTNYKYSAYLSPIITPSTYMTRENGFYPHNESDGLVQYPLTFKLADASEIKGISFYMYWRADKFRTSPDVTGILRENIATIAYRDENNIEYKQYLNVVTDSSPSLGYRVGHITIDKIGFGAFGQQFNKDYDKISSSTSIYVDGELKDEVEAGRWHMIYIDLTNKATEVLMNTNHSVRFVLNNNKSVVNYVTSHSSYINPKNLMCARFGFADDIYFDFKIDNLDMFYDDGILTGSETLKTTIGEHTPLKLSEDSKIVLTKDINDPGNSGVEPVKIIRINEQEVTL